MTNWPNTTTNFARASSPDNNINSLGASPSFLMPSRNDVLGVGSIEAKLQSPLRRRSTDQFSDLARLVMLTNTSNSNTNSTNSANPSPPPELTVTSESQVTPQPSLPKEASSTLKPPTKTGTGRAQENGSTNRLLPNGASASLGAALTDTPLPSAPGSPHMQVLITSTIES